MTPVPGGESETTDLMEMVLNDAESGLAAVPRAILGTPVVTHKVTHTHG